MSPVAPASAPGSGRATPAAPAPARAEGGTRAVVRRRARARQRRGRPRAGSEGAGSSRVGTSRPHEPARRPGEHRRQEARPPAAESDRRAPRTLPPHHCAYQEYLILLGIIVNRRGLVLAGPKRLRLG